ncbi:Ferredoxin:CoB-CoM heterodisulfide reductase, subunit A [Desulfonema limicola]|uniref:Ferredoxin:CoB-CoM heterodisulfide reductase, subunit A n=1 Tax=Desulfonema limicola TaxID=45656 RepID=A0A975GIP3_9BACT|nr:CoB--CoM heterodisulfide reductase iron-sulfur subunit A family protein [Desulfonema limicola]QTA82574.1 Ferredoxin:CoB-CoM heterodisulfide reductase, subunit A [Desulfonema limicola]
MTDEKKEQTAQAGKEKVGVYICYCGGNISDHVDVEKVRERMEKVPGVAVAKTNMFMCSDPGQELIMDDLKNGIIDRVVVASCAPSLHETTFRDAISRAGANPYIYEHANIREQVSWVHHGDTATDKAALLISAAAAKAGHLKPLEPIRVNARQHATIIGCGIAGMKAAKDMADQGIKVMIVEKSPFIGGRLARLDRLAPTGEKASDIIKEMASQVLNNPMISVLTCAEVEQFSGYVGNFDLEIKRSLPESETQSLDDLQKEKSQAGPGGFIKSKGICPGVLPEKEERIKVETGVIVLATGFSSYVPVKGEYGFGEYNEVVTLPDFIEKMTGSQADNGPYLNIDGKMIRSIGIIHCVGSRQIPGIHSEDEKGYLNEYCSRTCCSSSLYTANRIREKYPQTRVYDFYRDIRTYGRGQEELYSQAAKNKVVFFRFEAEEAPEVEKNTGFGNYPLKVKVKDGLTFGEEIEVPVDMLVLATGMEPDPISKLVEKMKLPVGVDRFLLEVHPKLRPVELPIGGILLAGTCQAPMDAGEVCNAASAAAVKAAGVLGKGYVELDPFVAEVDIEKCRGTGECVNACLNEGALRLVQMEINGQNVQKAEVTPALCLGCGACVAVCPENAIDINGWTLNQYEAMVDRIVSQEVLAA